MVRPLKKFFFDTLPLYFRVFDADKVGGEGILERFIKALEYEAEDTYTSIYNTPDLYSPADVPLAQLYYLGSIFGNPPTLFGLTSRYRKLLSYMPSLLKLKGTLLGLTNLFKLLGVTIVITDESEPRAQYDINQEYDTPSPALKYDTNCNRCFIISIDIMDPDGNLSMLASPSVLLLNELRNLVYFMVPINVYLKSVSYDGTPLGFYLLNEDSYAILVEDGKHIIPST